MATKKRPKSNGVARVNPTAECRWLGRLGMYHVKRALEFESKEDLHKAIDAIWDPDDELYRMPHAPADGLTMVVPGDAVPVFRARNFRFTEYPVMPAVRHPSRPKDSNVA